MKEQTLRKMYAMAMMDTVGAAPASVFEQPLNPILLKFAEDLIRHCARIAEEGDSHQTYNLGVDICEEFGLTV
jgi:hypothetical protein